MLNQQINGLYLVLTVVFGAVSYLFGYWAGKADKSFQIRKDFIQAMEALNELVARKPIGERNGQIGLRDEGFIPQSPKDIGEHYQELGQK